MRRNGLFCALIALATVPASAGDGILNVTRKATSSLTAPQHDPNCPGCRAFLAGFAPVSHAPSCGCEAPLAGGPGAPGAPGAAGEELGLGEELLAADFGTGYGYESAAPGMIGDFFGGLLQMRMGSIGQLVPTNVSIAGADRRFKIAESYSPYPTDRIFFNYNHFHNALLTADARQANFNRGTFGVETTMLDQMMSLEFRLPFGSGLNGTQIVDSTADNVSNELGNIAFALKGLVLQRDTVAITAGVGVVLPTGPDTTLFGASDPNPFFILHNNAYYLQPFAGVFWVPNDQLFTQFAVQADFDARGNRVEFPQVSTFTGGRLQDQALLFLDLSVGYWLFHDPNSSALITGLAPMVELHYNTTLENADVTDAADGSLPGSGPNFPGEDVATNFRNRSTRCT